MPSLISLVAGGGFERNEIRVMSHNCPNRIRTFQSSINTGGMECQGKNFEPIFDTPLGPIVQALAQLSPSSQNLVSSLVRQLAEREGINMAVAESPGLKTPADGIPLVVGRTPGSCPWRPCSQGHVSLLGIDSHPTGD